MLSTLNMHEKKRHQLVTNLRFPIKNTAARNNNGLRIASKNKASRVFLNIWRKEQLIFSHCLYDMFSFWTLGHLII